jgi:hypothetical protein
MALGLVGCAPSTVAVGGDSNSSGNDTGASEASDDDDEQSSTSAGLTTASAGSTSQGPETADGTSHSGAPTVLQVTGNLSALGPEDALIITALVQDSDGEADIVSGSLLSQTGSASYGSFQPSANPGSYTLALTWGEINAVEAITYDGPSGREFLVEFADQGGNVGSKPFQIQFDCAIACEGTCAGECSPFTAPCPGSSDCLTDLETKLWRCFPSTGDAEFLSECTDNAQCAAGLLCYSGEDIPGCTFEKCCSPMCDAAAPCPTGLACKGIQFEEPWQLCHPLGLCLAP